MYSNHRFPIRDCERGIAVLIFSFYLSRYSFFFGFKITSVFLRALIGGLVFKLLFFRISLILLVFSFVFSYRFDHFHFAGKFKKALGFGILLSVDVDFLPAGDLFVVEYWAGK